MLANLLFLLLLSAVSSSLLSQNQPSSHPEQENISQITEATLSEEHLRETQTEEELPFIPNVRRKLLAQAYEFLADAIESDDIANARTLFVTFPGLAVFACQPLGTPLHFVKSKAMAQFLVEEIGISASACDQWGELPSRALQLSKHDRFASKKEQRAIVQYLKSRESTRSKIWYQLACNKNLQMKLSIGVMSSVLITQLAALIKFLATK